MNTREEFGSYVLLKKLQEDALGETFRAGKMGPQGLDRVALLRVFNGEGLDTEQLAQGLEAQRPIQEILKSPNIGSGIDLGQVADVPYVAYDYISGADLASLMMQAVKSHNPVPVDHALLIGERLALGLAVANENRIRDQRIYHGCLLPQLVMLSSEGETRILGFEAGPSLRAQAAGPIGEAVTRYLSPEALAGATLSRVDDVYSLGVILFELLTGATLPAGTVDISVVEAAVRESGRPALPVGVAALIQKSLVPAAERLPDAATWHKALSKMMVDAQLSPTTFNLAFFMHSLFRDEIEQESEELEVEKTLTMQSIGGAPSLATTAIPLDLLHTGLERQAETSPAEIGEGTGSLAASAVATTAPGKKRGLMAAAAIGAIALLSLGYWFFQRSKQPVPPAESQVVDAISEPKPTPFDDDATTDALAIDPLTGEPLSADEDGVPGEENPEETDALSQQIDAMLNEKTAAMEASFRADYENRLKALQRQLDEAQRDSATRDTTAAMPVETETETDEVATAEVSEPESSPATDADDAMAQGGPNAASATLPQGGSSPVTGSKAPDGGADPGNGSSSADNTNNLDSKPTAATTPPPAEIETKPEPVVAKPAPVRRGELVVPGPGVIEPKMTRSPRPRFPTLARKLNKKAVVSVRVLVDETGKVTRTELAGEKVGFGFDQAALAAARTAGFAAATKRGVAVKMWKTLRIKFE